jgi:hypothetical protein
MSNPRVRSTAVLSVVMVLIGVALIVRTLSAGGGVLALGILLGVLFCVAGAGRLSMLRQRLGE